MKIVKVGQEFDLKIKIDDVCDCIGASFYLKYEPVFIKPVYKNGKILAHAMGFFDNPVIGITHPSDKHGVKIKNKLSVAILSETNKPSTGSGLVIAIRFVAECIGTTEIIFEDVIIDSTSGLLPVEWDNLTIKIIGTAKVTAFI